MPPRTFGGGDDRLRGPISTKGLQKTRLIRSNKKIRRYLQRKTLRGGGPVGPGSLGFIRTTGEPAKPSGPASARTSGERPLDFGTIAAGRPPDHPRRAHPRERIGYLKESLLAARDLPVPPDFRPMARERWRYSGGLLQVFQKKSPLISVFM